MSSTPVFRLPSYLRFTDPNLFSDWTRLDTHSHYLDRHTLEQQELLRVVREKLHPNDLSNYTDEWQKLHGWKCYPELATLVSLSGYDRRTDIVHCGFSRGRRFRCRDGLLCPRCALSKSTGLVGEFGRHFAGSGNVYYLVLSLSEEQDYTRRFVFREEPSEDLAAAVAHGWLGPSRPHGFGTGFATEQDLNDCRLYWQFFAEAVAKLTGGSRRPLFGAVRIPELAVHLRPLRVLPHCNIIGWGYLSESLVREAREVVSNKIRNCRRLTTPLYPSIGCYRIGSGTDLERVLRYSINAINLGEAYVVAAAGVNGDPVAMSSLNQDANTFLHQLPLVFRHMPRVVRLGECHPGHKDYFGSRSQTSKTRPGRGRAVRRPTKESSQPRREDPDWQRARQPRFPGWLLFGAKPVPVLIRPQPAGAAASDATLLPVARKASA